MFTNLDMLRKQQAASSSRKQEWEIDFGLILYSIMFRHTNYTIKSNKDKQYIIHMVDRAVEICDKRILQATIPSLPKNIASTPRPDKNQVIADQRSRFSTWAFYECYILQLLKNEFMRA